MGIENSINTGSLNPNEKITPFVSSSMKFKNNPFTLANLPSINNVEVETLDMDIIIPQNVTKEEYETYRIQNINECMLLQSEIAKAIEYMEDRALKYTQEFNDVQSKYELALDPEKNYLWYSDGILLRGEGSLDIPMTPEEYEIYLMGENSFSLEDFENNEEFQNQIQEYKTMYEQKFLEITGMDYSTYVSITESYEENMFFINGSIYSLKQQQMSLFYETLVLSNVFQQYINSHSQMTREELEEYYNSYNDRSIDISTNGEISQNMYDSYNPFYFLQYAEILAEEQEFDITDVLDKQVQSPHYNLTELYECYNVMAEDERKIYCYYFDTEGREKAESYYKEMKNIWNQRIGYDMAQREINQLVITEDGQLEDNLANMLNVSVDGLEDGIQSFIKGIENAIENNETISKEEYKIMLYLQYLETNSNVLDKFYQVGMGVGNMIPSVTASLLTVLVAPQFAPKVGQTLMGISAFGNSKHTALTEGYNLTTSIVYGLLSAGSEVMFEKVGGILGISDNPGSNFIIRLLKEGGEEFSQTYVMAGIDAVVLGKEINLDELSAESVESFGMGVLVAAALNLYSSGVSSTLTIIQNGQELNISYKDLVSLINKSAETGNLDVNRIMQEAIENSAQTAGRLDINSSNNTDIRVGKIQYTSQEVSNYVYQKILEMSNKDPVFGIIYNNLCKTLGNFYVTNIEDANTHYTNSGFATVNVSHWSLQDSWIALGNDVIQQDIESILFHELGHAFLDTIGKYSQWSGKRSIVKAITKARLYLEQNPDILKNFVEQYQFTCQQSYNKARLDAISEANYIIGERSYYDIDEVNNILESLGMSPFIYVGENDFSDLVYDSYVTVMTNEKYQKVLRESGYDALSDMVTTLFGGRETFSQMSNNGSSYGFVGHDSSYYGSPFNQNYDFEFHELFANYYAIRQTGNLNAYKVMEEVLDKKLLKLLEKTYKDIVNKSLKSN